MTHELLSVGIDIGTTTSQLVFSRIKLVNQANGASIPDIQIVSKEVVYQSAIYYTPLTPTDQIDFPTLREIIFQEYQRSGFQASVVQTGAVIITGESSRKENAQYVLESLAQFAGDFVVSTAGPDLEAVLAGWGAGTGTFSQKQCETIVNFDIGGGTTNAAVFQNGEIIDTYALDIGGRLLRFDEHYRITYLSKRLLPLVQKLELPFNIGEEVSFQTLQKLTQHLAKMFLELLDYEPLSAETEGLFIGHSKSSQNVQRVSFSGGVAEFIYQATPVAGFEDLPFNDIGPLLGQSIRKVLLSHAIPLLEPAQKIRATVLGAGNHSVSLSGSTITYCEKVLPIKNIPVIKPFLPGETEVPEQLHQKIASKLGLYPEGVVAIAFCGTKSPRYAEIQTMACQIAAGLAGRSGPYIIILEHDFAKALGQALLAETKYQQSILCLDRLKVKGGDYIDIGTPVADVIPVVIKTLVFNI